MKKLKNDHIWGMPAVISIFFPFPYKSVMIDKFKTTILFAILIPLKHFLAKESDRLRVMKQGAKEEIWA
jgi:hypothetical protein